MPRWDRGAAWLPPDAVRVLDAGAAFGFGTARVAAAVGRRARRTGRRPLVVGLEYDAGYAATARRRYPTLPFLRGSADRLPFADEAFDAVLLLDVLEHLPDAEVALAEAWRVLRPSGALIVSVPHAGALAALDSLNLYSAIRDRLPALPPLDPTERGHPRHRHYSLAELRHLLGDRFVVERILRTGLGLSEPLNLLLLLLCRGLLRSGWLYGVLRFAYFGAHLLEDLVPTGRRGYSVTIKARRRRLGLSPRGHASCGPDPKAAGRRPACSASGLGGPRDASRRPCAALQVLERRRRAAEPRRAWLRGLPRRW